MHLLHLNIWKGAHIDTIVNFVRKNDFDFLSFQEVSTGQFSFAEINCLEKIQKSLSYSHEMTIDLKLIHDRESYEGNAIFFKKSFLPLNKKIIKMKDEMALETTTMDWTQAPRSAIALQFEKEDKKFWIINTHLAWGLTPDDKDYKIAQAQILRDQIKKLKGPFILTGDFNVTPETKVISLFNSLGRNVTVENNITNTLNPQIHHAKHLFPAGLAVDYMFTKDITVNSFHLVKHPTLSDHLGLTLDFNL
jgi:endonuclease/exonuclease/phosphatase family metal-dependent hydrolase